MKIGSANHFTATMYPRLAAVITCSMSVWWFWIGERGNAYRICEDDYQKRVTW